MSTKEKTITKCKELLYALVSCVLVAIAYYFNVMLGMVVIVILITINNVIINNKISNIKKRISLLEIKHISKSSSDFLDEFDIFNLKSNTGEINKKLSSLEERLLIVENETDKNNLQIVRTPSVPKKSQLSNMSSIQKKRSNVSMSIEDKYNKLKYDGNENDFVIEFHCERIGIKDYQDRMANPGMGIALENDNQGWFFVLQDSYKKLLAVPIFSAQIKSRYYEMFSTVYIINEVNTNNDFNLIKSAKIKAIGNNKYVVLEKGIIEI